MRTQESGTDLILINADTLYYMPLYASMSLSYHMHKMTQEKSRCYEYYTPPPIQVALPNQHLHTAFLHKNNHSLVGDRDATRRHKTQLIQSLATYTEPNVIVHSRV